MTTLPRFFQSMAALISGQLPIVGFDDPFSWYNNLPDVPIERLPGFQSSIEEPSPRKCCAIGWRTSTWWFPQVSATRPLDVQLLHDSMHKYGGSSNLLPPSYDRVGHAYTARGGIIDIGHVRDHADLARYLACQARMGLQHGWIVNLKAEGGERRIHFLPQGMPPDPRLCALIGARLSYELSIWHEIVTWASAARLEHQPYSAFSPEDNFSNLLGAYLGFRAILTPETDFDTAMMHCLLDALVELGPVWRDTATLAVDYVEHRWFYYDDGKLQLLRRHFDALPAVTPWLIQTITIPGKEAMLARLREVTYGETQPVTLAVPEVGLAGEDLSSYYKLEIQVDTSSLSLSFLSPLTTTITPANFPALIDKVKSQVLTSFPDGHLP